MQSVPLTDAEHIVLNSLHCLSAGSCAELISDEATRSPLTLGVVPTILLDAIVCGRNDFWASIRQSGYSTTHELYERMDVLGLIEQVQDEPRNLKLALIDGRVLKVTVHHSEAAGLSTPCKVSVETEGESGAWVVGDGVIGVGILNALKLSWKGAQLAHSLFGSGPFVEPFDPRDDRYESGEWLERERGIYQTRVSAKSKVRRKYLQPGEAAPDGSKARVLYHVGDAMRYCRPRRLKGRKLKSNRNL
ncbi:hypothetical protein RAS2_21670 [Phycisphaerae bacterium RAS2]|nr:hypothetical protein RAS2_21670 [Phycisphaerae bacterium RAS2]